MKSKDSSNKHYLYQELLTLIRQDESILNFLERSTLDGVWYWDLQNPEHEWMSPSFWETLGYDPSTKSHLASEWQDIINQEDLKLAVENFAKHLEDPNHPYDQIVRYKHQTGKTVWIRCRGMAIRNSEGIAIRMLGAHIDITQLKEQEYKELEQERQHKTFFEKQSLILEKLEKTAKIGSWELDLGNNEISWSSQTKEIHEVDNDYVPCLETALSFYNDEQADALTNSIELCKKDGCGWEHNLKLITKKGNVKWVRIIGTPVFIDGDCISIFGVIQDVSKQKLLEHELESARKQSEARRIKAEASERAKSVFLSNMSHEIRTPMNAILGALQILEPQVDDVHAHKVVRSALSAATGLLTVINDILDFSKIESGSVVLEEIPFLAQDILHEVEFSIEHMVKSKDIVFRISVDKDFKDGWIGDPGRLKQILINLVHNAVKFTSQGSVDLKVSSCNENDKCNLCFDIIDTGIGMEPEQVKMVFERFNQADASVTRRYGGSGLGLSICKNLIQLMRGELDVISELYKGTTVRVRLLLETSDKNMVTENFRITPPPPRRDAIISW